MKASTFLLLLRLSPKLIELQVYLRFPGKFSDVMSQQKTHLLQIIIGRKHETSSGVSSLALHLQKLPLKMYQYDDQFCKNEKN